MQVTRSEYKRSVPFPLRWIGTVFLVCVTLFGFFFYKACIYAPTPIVRENPILFSTVFSVVSALAVLAFPFPPSIIWRNNVRAYELWCYPDSSDPKNKKWSYEIRLRGFTVAKLLEMKQHPFVLAFPLGGLRAGKKKEYARGWFAENLFVDPASWNLFLERVEFNRPLSDGSGATLLRVWVRCVSKSDGSFFETTLASLDELRSELANYTVGKLLRGIMDGYHVAKQDLERANATIERAQEETTKAVQQRDLLADQMYLTLEALTQSVNNTRAGQLRQNLADVLLSIVQPGDSRYGLAKRFADPKRPPRPTGTSPSPA